MFDINNKASKEIINSTPGIICLSLCSCSCLPNVYKPNWNTIKGLPLTPLTTLCVFTSMKTIYFL